MADEEGGAVMDIASLGLRIDNTQATQAINQTGQQLDALATKAEADANRVARSFSRMSAPAVTGFRQMAVAEQEAKTVTTALNHEIEATHGISHSAVIGVGELARGIGRVAEAGQLGAFAMREFSGSAMRLGAVLGPAGGLAGIVVLLGGVIIETFTKARREMEETRQKFEEEIAKMANAAQASDLSKRMRDLLYGQPFDDKNQLAAVSKYVQGAFENSLADLEAHYAALQSQVPRGATMAPAKIADEWNKVVKALDAAREQYAKLRTAALNVANQPADMAGLLPVVTTAKITDVQKELEAQAKATAASMDLITKSLKDSEPEWTLNAKQYQTTIDMLKVLNEQEDTLVKIGERNAKVGADQVNAAAAQIKAAQKYSDDLRKIWRDGIAKITTDGFKSFQDFAEDLNQLFTRLMDKMAERARALGKEAGGAGYTALGIGVAGLSGFSSGYSSGSAATGLIGGALAGSPFGPIGIAVGALAGLTGGLLGGSQAAKQRKEAEDQLRQSLSQSLTSIRVQMGQLTQLDGQIADAQAQFAARAKQINDAYSGKKNQTEREQLLAQNTQLEQQYIDWLKKQAAATAAATQAAEDAAAAQQALADAQKNSQAQGSYQLRFLNATGRSDAAFALQQQLELDQAIADGLDAISIRLLQQAQDAEKAQREQEKQTQLLQDQLSTAQQQADALQQIYSSLDDFSKSLVVGQYSPLSPRQQLDASRQQLGALYKLALSGDQNAAGQFGSTAQQFLDASRKYNASGAGYQLDYNSVKVMTDALKQQFGSQLTDAQKQVSLLQQQLDALKSIDTGIGILVNRPNLTPQIPSPVPIGTTPKLQPIGGITADDAVAVLQAGFTAMLEAQAATTGAVDDGLRRTAIALDELRQAS